MSRCDRSFQCRYGFNVLELIVTLGVISLLLAIVVPAIQSVRESSRSTQCTSHLRQVMQGTMSFESAAHRFPKFSTAGRTRDGVRHLNVCPLVEILPHVGHTDVYSKLNRAEPISGANGYGPPATWFSENQPYLNFSVRLYQCPSDTRQPGSCNVRSNLGTGPNWDSLPPIGPGSPCHDPRNGNGAFEEMKSHTPAAFMDGLANTVFYSERVIGSFQVTGFNPWRDYSQVAETWPRCTSEELANTCRSIAGIANSASFSGSTWLFASKSQTAYDHILPPNAKTPDCSADSPGYPASMNSAMAARSQHPGLVNAVMGDASVRAIHEAIDLGVWRSISTRWGGE